MNVQDAAYATVHAYPGGSESLAPRLGMSAAVLRGKVNPNNERNILSLQEADRIMGVTGDHRILHALAAEHGYTLQASSSDATVDLLSSALSASTANGDLCEVIAKALADGQVNPNELADIARACAAVQERVVAISRGAAARVRRGPEAAS